ncbi:MAG: sulfate ABC transporter permease subunit CysT [Deltaproteobacteria bacterium]|jgi:sulfate transport system permease protein|nr:sulfate ABC transporter permease subunit CysT [Deltaproteobacteria bacterium]
MSRNRRALPGFGLSFGVTMSYVGFIVLIPMFSLTLQAVDVGFGGFWRTVTDPRILASCKVSLQCSLAAALINSVFGTMLAWVLVRYRFPGRRLIDSLVELPFALPTAVAGIALTALTVDKGWIGGPLATLGLRVAYTRLGIVVALVFITLPFVVRAVQPVLEQLPKDYEEAGRLLGAKPGRIFLRVILPEIKLALLTGFSLAFARGLGEYGSVIFIAGNKPYQTETAPLMIVTRLEEFLYGEATALAVALLAVSFIMMFFINRLQIRAAAFAGER